MKKLLDKKNDDYTQDGLRCYQQALAALRIVKQAFIKEGFSAKEIDEIFGDLRVP